MLHKAANAPLRQDSVAKRIFLVLFMNIKKIGLGKNALK